MWRRCSVSYVTRVSNLYSWLTAGPVLPLTFSNNSEVVGCGEGVVYLTSPGCPTDTRLAILVAGKGRGECF